MFHSDFSHTRSVGSFLNKVYGWMGLALCLTAAAAWTVFNVPAIHAAVFSHPAVLLVLILAQLGLVLVLSWGLPKLSVSAALMIFFGYSLLTGVTLSSILFVYTAASVAASFLVTAGMFLSMAIYGTVTKSDLSTFGNIAFMGLIGVILASVVNMFIGSTGLEFLISFAAVVIFTILTAYDAQNIIMMAHAPIDGDMRSKLAIHGALRLYLDFINLFLYVLRFLGRRRN